MQQRAVLMDGKVRWLNFQWEHFSLFLNSRNVDNNCLLTDRQSDEAKTTISLNASSNEENLILLY